MNMPRRHDVQNDGRDAYKGRVSRSLSTLATTSVQSTHHDRAYRPLARLYALNKEQ